MVAELFVPRKGLVVPKPPSYVKLDMAFGVGAGTTLFDKSRYRSHGAITGAAWATGLHGKCLDFIPTTPSYVEIPASQTQLNFTVEDFSIIFRAKVDVLVTLRVLIMRGLTDADGWWWFVYDDGDMYFDTFQAGLSQRSSAAAGTIAAATWYTIGMSRDGASVKLYVNGVDVTSVSGTHINPLTSSRSAKIGIYDDKAHFPSDGKIEFLRIFGGIALSTSEHLAYHNALA